LQPDDEAARAKGGRQGPPCPFAHNFWKKIFYLMGKTGNAGSRFYPLFLTPDFFDVLRLESFGALHYLKLHQLIFLECPKAVFLDGAVMHEDIGAVFPGNKSKPFGIIEPLHLTLHLH
jgi:hypothetical protein